MKKFKIAVLALSILVVIESALIIFLLASRPKKIPRVAAPEIKGEIAIVIDDWGYNLNNLAALRQIKYPLTLSILPNLAFSAEVADEAHSAGKEVILHLPMQPHEKFRLEQNTVMTSMDESEILGILANDIEAIPHIKGASNHMGSLATEDARTMEIVLNELKRRHLYFLDSFVTSKSVCSMIAKRLHLGFARRDIFLDNNEETQYIKRQVNKLKSKARAYGRAIGIGHDRRITLEALKETMPQLAKEGYKFVFVSELVK